MADRYWVGGTGTWNTTSTTNWSATSGGSSGASVPTAADSVFFDSNSGSNPTITLTGALACLDIIVSATTFTFTSTGTIAISGSMSLTSGTVWNATGTLTFNATSSKSILTNGTILSCSVTLNGVGGIWAIASALTLGSARTLTLTNGTIDLTNSGAGNYTLSTGLFSSVNTNTRAITFGTGNITLTGNSAIIWNTSTSTNFSYTGTPTVNATYSGSTGTRTFANGNTAGGSEASAISLNIFAGADTITFTSSLTNSFKNIDFTGFSGSHSSGAYAVYGNYKISSTMTWVSNTSTISFLAASGTQQITSSGVVIDQPITQNNSGATLQLQDNLTMGSTRTFTLTAGTLDLNSKTLSTGIFSSNNSNTRSISFGTGNLNLTAFGTGTTNIFVMNTVTGFSYTGTSKVTISGAGTSGNFRQLIFQTGATESNSLNYFVNNGSDQIIMQSFYCKNLDFTGFSGSVSDNNKNIYGNLILSSTMTYSNSTGITSFIASSGTQTLTTNGTTLDAPLTQNNSGATLQLQDNLTLGSTRTYTHTSGTLDLNAKTATINTFSSTGTGTRAITFNSGTLSISGTTTSAFTASGSDLTTSAGSGVGTMDMTAATAKTFAGGGFTYAAKLNQGGAGTLTITGSNTFNDITVTTLPSTITFTAGTTQTVTQFTASGTAGNLLTLNSSSAGSPFTLSDSSGTINVSYCSITDSIATGGATWNSLLTNGNVDGGGNTGWIFTVAPVVYGYSSDIKLRSMAQRGRF